MQRTASRRRGACVHGFTLLELLVVVAVAAILLTLGIPAFNSLGARTQQTAEINGFVRHLQLARSYAVKTGHDHVLCPSSDLIVCREDRQWQRGYILFEDRDQNGTRDAQEALLAVSRPDNPIGIHMQSTLGRQRVVYRPDGRSAGSNLTLTFCDPTHVIAPKAVIVSNTGRPRIATVRGDGKPLNCGP